MNLGFDYVMDHHLNTEEKYPYKGRDQTCKTKEIGEGEVTLTGCVKLEQKTSALVEALRIQPVSVAFYVNLTFQFYWGGVFNPWFCNGEPNHGVLAVGFNLTDRVPWFKFKNSWSEAWGESGYFRMAIGTKDSGTCNLTAHDFNYYPLV